MRLCSHRQRSPSQAQHSPLPSPEDANALRDFSAQSRTKTNFDKTDRQAIYRRVYPKPESLAVALFSGAGEANFEQVTAWDIAPTNPF